MFLTDSTRGVVTSAYISDWNRMKMKSLLFEFNKQFSRSCRSFSWDSLIFITKKNYDDNTKLQYSNINGKLAISIIYIENKHSAYIMEVLTIECPSNYYITSEEYR